MFLIPGAVHASRHPVTVTLQNLGNCIRLLPQFSKIARSKQAPFFQVVAERLAKCGARGNILESLVAISALYPAFFSRQIVTRTDESSMPLSA